MCENIVNIGRVVVFIITVYIKYNFINRDAVRIFHFMAKK